MAGFKSGGFNSRAPTLPSIPRHEAKICRLYMVALHNLTILVVLTRLDVNDIHGQNNINHNEIRALLSLEVQECNHSDIVWLLYINSNLEIGKYQSS